MLPLPVDARVIIVFVFYFSSGTVYAVHSETQITLQLHKTVPCMTVLKGVLSGLRPFLATESPLKMMKHAFYFTLKAPFVLKILKFWF